MMLPRLPAWLAALLVSGSLLAASASASDLALRWLKADGSLVAERALDLAGLDALPQRVISTGTPWTKGRHTFAGPPLAALAALAGLPATSATVIALNEYSASLPRQDWSEKGAVLASRQDGRTMRIRDKGPYWVMFPIDDSREFDSEKYRSRMVWQVRSIDFLVE